MTFRGSRAGIMERLTWGFVLQTSANGQGGTEDIGSNPRICHERMRQPEAAAFGRMGLLLCARQYLWTSVAKSKPGFLRLPLAARNLRRGQENAARCYVSNLGELAELDSPQIHFPAE